MKKRLITGIVYLAVLLAFFLLRRYVHVFFFDLLLLLFCAAGEFEMLRALGDRLDRVSRWIVGASSAAVMLCCTLSASFFPLYAGGFTLAAFSAGVLAILSPLIFRHEKASLETAGLSFLAFLYPTFFLAVLSAVNHLAVFSEIGVLFVFAICPFADCFAYVFGRLLGKKYPRKMSPHVSPNKTVVGGLGGLFGGALGALALFFLQFYALGPTAYGTALPPPYFSYGGELVFFLFVGILAAAAAEIGDLAESAVKRKLGIKDMGKLLPGHGGVLDRIDSALYAGVIVYLVFLLRLMSIG